jgi:alkanesulfonate monooxygenase SsuD/methylene tetrahydromethanopterin reductase-like flavin-dependent oxidoreductase (luciferase family)
MQESEKREGSLEFDWQHKRPIGPDWNLENFADGIQIERSVQMREYLAEIVQVFIQNFAQDSSAINHQKHQVRLVRIQGVGNPNHLIWVGAVNEPISLEFAQKHAERLRLLPTRAFGDANQFHGSSLSSPNPQPT